MTRLAPALLALLLFAQGAGADDPAERDYDADSEERSEFWERVLEPDRDEYLAKLDHGRQLLGEGDVRSLELAERVLREASRLVPDDARAHFWLGRVHYRRAHELSSDPSSDPTQGESIAAEWSQCARAMARAHRLDDAYRPENKSPAWTLDYELSRCYAGAGRYDEAMDHLKEILTGGVIEEPGVHALLAEVYMALGRLDSAIASFENARRLKSPHDAELNFALAVAYDRAERRAPAREHLEAALSREPRFHSLWAHGKAYVPPADMDYYLGLARAAKGEPFWSIYYFRRYLARAGEDVPWRRRAREHLEDLKEVEPSASLRVKGTAKLDRERAAAVIARADKDLQECVESTPPLLLEVRITRYAAARGADLEELARRGGPPPGVHVVLHRHFGLETEAIQAAMRCVDGVSAGLALPRPAGSGATYASLEFMVIAR